MQNVKAVAFTGHRPEYLPFSEGDAVYGEIKQRLLAEIKHCIEEGCTVFYGGMARGMDIVFGELVLEVHKSYPFVQFIGVIPYEEQASRWNESWRTRYFDLMAHAASEILISAHYTRDCYQRRNRYMVDHADVLIAVYSGSSAGGTAYTVEYAKKKGKRIVCINPAYAARSFFHGTFFFP